MRRITALTTPGLALLLFLMVAPSARAQTNNKPRGGNEPAPAASAAPSQIWDVCWVRGTDYHADQFHQPVYVSGAVPLASIADYPVVPAAFVKSVANKLPNGVNSTADCIQKMSQAEALSFIKQGGSPGILDCTRANCIMTDWTYTRDQNAAPAPAAAGQPDSCYVYGGSDGHSLIKRPGCVAPALVTYVICYTSDTSPTDYISATFKVNAMDKPGWTNGFTQLLAQKYSYKDGTVACANVDENGAQTFSKNLVGVWRTRGKTVIETGWVFGSSPVVPVVIPAAAAAAPPAPAPAAAAAPTQPSTLYAHCFGVTSGANGSAYFSAPFTTTARNTPAWTKDFRAFLTSKYGAPASALISCNVSPTQEALDQNTQHYKDQYGPSHKIVDTGWSYDSSAPAAAATPSPASAASAPAAPIAPSAQDTKYSVCWAEVPADRTAYFSAPFPYAANFEQARTEYRKFLIAKYGQVGQLNCRAMPSLSEAQQQMQTWKDSARARDQLVDTAWKPE